MIFSYHCTTTGLYGVVPVFGSLVLMWVIEMQINAIKEHGVVGYLKSWIPNFLKSDVSWNYSDKLNIPEDMCCSITFEPFVNPVICGDFIFEQKAVKQWIIDHG